MQDLASLVGELLMAFAVERPVCRCADRIEAPVRETPAKSRRLWGPCQEAYILIPASPLTSLPVSAGGLF